MHVGASVVTTGNRKSVPILARMTFGFVMSVRGLIRITASTPTASAVRSRVPILPGFSMPSAINNKGFGESLMSASLGEGSVARAMSPSGCSR